MFVFGNVDSKKIITSCSHTDLLWWTSMLNIYLYRTCDFGDGLLLDFVTTLFGIHWNNIIALQVQLSIQSSCDTVLTTSPCHFPWEIPLSDDQPLSIGAPFGTPHLAFEIDTCQHRAAHEIDQQSLETWQLLARQKGDPSRKNGRNDLYQWIGLREHLQETPIFNGKIDGFL